MCGICGVMELGGKPVDEVLLTAMNDTMAHRGPDGAGVHVEGPVGLGHRRLSIIDLGGGRQPMSTPDGRLTVVFNGEIYNYQELKAELSSKGHVFQTQSDTECLLYGYREWGEDFVAKLRGMFAFALWDQDEQRLVLARDRLGKKPLYYHLGPERLVFGSELKAVLAHGSVDRSLDPDALSAYLSFGYVPAPLSIHAGIKKLLPAHLAVLDAKGWRTKRYWTLDMDAASSPLSFEEAVEELESVFDEAVRVRLMSDVPLGAFLSGGVDSSAVVAAMAAMNPADPVRTAAIGFSDKAFDELGYAKVVAEHVGADHGEFTVQPSSVDVARQLVKYFDEPFADASAIPTWYVCQMARQRVTVALSGDGGDEVFAGYIQRYTMVRFEDQVRRNLGPLSGLAGALGTVYPRLDTLPRPLRLKRFLSNLGLGLEQAYFRDMSFGFSPEEKANLLLPEVARQADPGGPERLLTQRFAETATPEAVSRAQYADMMFYLPEDILVKVDRMSMAHSLEVRAPILDHKLIEFAARLPSTFKLREGVSKAVFKRMLARRLPQEILDRKKQGFRVPLGKWLRGELKDLAHEAIFSTGHGNADLGDLLDLSAARKLWDAHQTGRENNENQLWNLIMLGLWRMHDAGTQA
jgi:asparagine synthase (glutamine-hydrolysing)